MNEEIGNKAPAPYSLMGRRGQVEVRLCLWRHFIEYWLRMEEQFVDEDPDPAGGGSAEDGTCLPGLCTFQAACDALNRWTIAI